MRGAGVAKAGASSSEPPWGAVVAMGSGAGTRGAPCGVVWEGGCTLTGHGRVLPAKPRARAV